MVLVGRVRSEIPKWLIDIITFFFLFSATTPPFLRKLGAMPVVNCPSVRQRETPRMAGSYFANACSVFSWLAHCLRLKFCVNRTEKKKDCAKRTSKSYCAYPTQLRAQALPLIYFLCQFSFSVLFLLNKLRIFVLKYPC